MNSFFATADSTTPDPVTIENDGWFPDIDLDKMRVAIRLDGTVTLERLQAAVVDAVLKVNDELSEWQKAQQDEGHADLASVPATKIADESKLLAYYRRAVYSMAKADLTERYRDYDTSTDGQKKAEQLDDSIEEQRRNARWAIADLVGRNHTTVELI